jgi:ankyrin repeat protein
MAKRTQSSPDPSEAFFRAAVWHGPLEPAESILRAHPEIASGGIYAASLLGDDEAVLDCLAKDPEAATRKGGPLGWDPLTYLCFSNYLRLDPARTPAFLRAAVLLLDAGASANTGFFENEHHSQPEFECALYGAAGVAHNAELTKLLLQHGADPNDAEVMYHTPETYDNDAMKALVLTGRMTADSLSSMLLRKHDWHDYEGAKWLLEHGADPNQTTRWRRTALHHAVLRDNARGMIELVLNHGGDLSLLSEGRSVVALAARRGRRDLLELFEARGIRVELEGGDRLIAACARDQRDTIDSIRSSAPNAVADVIRDGAKLLAEFAGNGNTDGVRNLLDLGVDVSGRFTDGDGYWGLAKESTALHSAAWRMHHRAVKLLLERGAPVDALDANGRTPLSLAVKACVDSYWSDGRSPESVEALLAAGASADKVAYPSGYDAVDKLLAQHRSRPV